MGQRISFWLGCALLCGLTSCGEHLSTDEPELGGDKKTSPATLTIATAANVQFVMDALIREFEAQNHITIESVVSSSGKLAAQILEGGPYDLFVSANMKYPEYLLDSGAAVGAAKVYAYGTLVAWSLTGKIVRVTPEGLLDQDVSKIAIANPKTAPYGEQAINYLQHYGVLEELRPKLVYGQSIAQTNQYIFSGAVDVGLTAKSVVLSPKMNGKGSWLELPQGSYDPIEQGVVMTQYGHSNHPKASLSFYAFLFSDTAGAIFEQYGYKLPEQNQ